MAPESDRASPKSVSTGSKVFRILWHRIHEQYEVLCRQTKCVNNFLHRESNKPLPKQLRRSLRLNKSAKKKGYKHYMSEDDRRRLEEYSRRHNEWTTRLDMSYGWGSNLT